MADRAGFVTFIRSNMGLSSTALPDDSTSIDTAYNMAVLLCDGWNIVTTTAGILDLLTYQLAGHYLIMYGKETCFTGLRKTFGMDMVGILNSASDTGTAGGFVIPDWVTAGGVVESELAKTPYGRQYLMVAKQLNSVLLVA
jgi:hypothetical protein